MFSSLENIMQTWVNLQNDNTAIPYRASTEYRALQETLHRENSVFITVCTELTWVKEIVILSKKVAILWVCFALKRVISFSAWDKSRNSTDNWRKLENM